MNPHSTLSTMNKTLALLLMVFVMTAAAKAQTAGYWSFNNTLNATHGSNLSASAASLGSSIPTQQFNSSTEFYGEGGWPTGALDPNAYLQISVTASSGYYLSLTSLYIVQRRSNTGNPVGSGPNSWSIRSSLDNYTTDITGGTITYNYADYPITLPAIFQSIPSTVTFRIYGYNATVTSTGYNRMVFDSILVYGKAIAGTLAEQSIRVTGSVVAPGHIDLSYLAAGFAAGADLSIERSANGQNFTSIAQQNVTTSSSDTYNYSDLTAPTFGSIFYRITATNPDGSSYTSPIIALQQTASLSTQIKAVVAQGSSVQTLLHLGESGTYELNIFSQDGKPLVRQNVSSPGGGDLFTDIALGARPHGMYVLTLAKEGYHSSRTFIY